VGELYGPDRFHLAAYQGKITYNMELIPMGPLDLSEKKATIWYWAIADGPYKPKSIF
jgi:hypothetical protein